MQYEAMIADIKEKDVKIDLIEILLSNTLQSKLRI